MSLLSVHHFTATPKALIKTLLLSTAVCATLVMTGCASKPQAGGITRYAKAPDFYTVRSGDTLSGIAARYGLNYVSIAEMNDIAQPYRIYVGQSIRLKNNNVQRTTTTEAVTQIAPIQRQKIAVPAATTPVIAEPVVSVGNTKANVISQPDTAIKSSNPVLNTVAGLQWTKPSSNSVLESFNLAKDIKGTRYSGKVGDPIYAAAEGQVVYAADGLKEYGNLVLIKHINGYVTAYAHNSKMLVKSGQNVTVGQKIAEMGATGTDRTMLEFQIRLNGKSIDPRTMFSNN